VSGFDEFGEEPEPPPVRELTETLAIVGPLLPPPLLALPELAEPPIGLLPAIPRLGVTAPRTLAPLLPLFDWA
jgi:hypothetical protein